MKRIVAFVFLFAFMNSWSQRAKTADSLGEILKQRNLSKEVRLQLLIDRAYHHQNIDTSLLLAKRALQIATELNKPVQQARAWEEIGHVERRLGNNDVSLQASLNALRIYESLQLPERQAASYAQLGSNSISDNDYVSAIAYLKKAEHIYQNSDKTLNQVLTTLNLGEAYRLAGHIDSAAICFKKTLKRNEELKNDIVQGYSSGNLGMVYSVQNEFTTAKELLTEAISILRNLGDDYSTSVYLAALGEIYQKERKWDLAEERLREALYMATTAGLKEQIRDFSAQLASLYENQGRFSDALYYQKKYQIYQDSLVNKASIQKIEQLKSSYEIDKRETEIGALNRINSYQKNTLISLVAGICLFIYLSYLLFKGNKTIKKANSDLSDQKLIIANREREKALLLKELNHRVKNNLQMIASLLNLQSRELTGHPAQEAIIAGKNRVEALSLVHSKLYQEGVETRIYLKEYIEELVLGLFHGYNINFEPDFDIAHTSISVDKAVPIALIINEIVINSLKYAYDGIKNPNLKVRVEETNTSLKIEISDNGVGFSKQEGEKDNSFGIKLITSLIQQLDGTIERTNLNGTLWTMKLKPV